MGSTSIGMERCVEYIRSQSHPAREVPTGSPAVRRRAVTISRQTGSGAHAVSEILMARLQADAPAGSTPWTVFDRELVDRVLEDHHMPGRLAKYMPEDRVSEASDILDGLFGVRPYSWTMVRRTAETILHLAELGNVVVIGRAGSIITDGLRHVLHVRLVGSVERRLGYLQEYRGLTRKAAEQYLHDEDLGRKRYVKKYYGKDVEDPLLYHLVINTDRVSYEEAAGLIAHELSAHELEPAVRPRAAAR